MANRTGASPGLDVPVRLCRPGHQRRLRQCPPQPVQTLNKEQGAWAGIAQASAWAVRTGRKLELTQGAELKDLVESKAAPTHPCVHWASGHPPGCTGTCSFAPAEGALVPELSQDPCPVSSRASRARRWPDAPVASHVNITTPWFWGLKMSVSLILRRRVSICGQNFVFWGEFPRMWPGS